MADAPFDYERALKTLAVRKHLREVSPTRYSFENRWRTYVDSGRVLYPAPEQDTEPSRTCSVCGRGITGRKTLAGVCSEICGTLTEDDARAVRQAQLIRDAFAPVNAGSRHAWIAYTSEALDDSADAKLLEALSDAELQTG